MIAEKLKLIAEKLRLIAEKLRKITEKLRMITEKLRLIAEKLIMIAEKMRMITEKMRMKVKKLRTNAEKLRITAKVFSKKSIFKSAVAQSSKLQFFPFEVFCRKRPLSITLMVLEGIVLIPKRTRNMTQSPAGISMRRKEYKNTYNRM